MKTLRKGDQGDEVIMLQELLINAGLSLSADGDFGNGTKRKVIEFQESKGLEADGIVGRSTWNALQGNSNSGSIFTSPTPTKPGFHVGIKERYLKSKEYFQEVNTKKTIYLHHTAGGPRPDYTIDWWSKDGKNGRARRVGTAFVIGRRSQKSGDRFDGVTYRCFDEKHWAHHLGLGIKNNNTSKERNKQYNQESIGIEICNYGHLSKIDGKYIGVGNTEIPESEVCILDKPWRGHRYFEKYTARQLEETKRIVLTMASIYNIPLPNIEYTRDWFDLKYDAIMGKPGLWTHVNVRYDKTDCFPDPNLIAMLNTLHEESKTFVPDLSQPMIARSMEIEREINWEEVQNYTRDLDDAWEE